ncbi:hypothetical protein [Sphingobacterium sp. MYb382]|uniref:hypothetical protein n=1 Tax=Sphingobacterium sp. MYb382 TaxID=2745278 RepID=UPI0030B6F12B
MFKLLHFLALFGYLNLLSFEVKYADVAEMTPITATDSLLEVLFEDVLNFESHSEKLPELMFDDYSNMVKTILLIPLFFILTWLCRKLLLFERIIKHPVYSFNRLPQPGYYTFLYRFFPF